MSTRPNKKRKGRNNVNRERTVTTLAEDPTTAFLVPTPTEDPPKSAISNSMSSPFSVTSSTGGGGNGPGAGMNSSSAYQASSPKFSGYNSYNNYGGSAHPSNAQQQHNQHQQPQSHSQFFSSPQQPILPPGANDLEVLEKLKAMIKSGQHEMFKPIPNPVALASVYLGVSASGQSQVPPHPEQMPEDQAKRYSQVSGPEGSTSQARGGPDINSGGGAQSRNRLQGKDSWDASGSRKAVPQPSVSGSQSTNNNLQQPSVLSAKDSLGSIGSNNGDHRSHGDPRSHEMKHSPTSAHPPDNDPWGPRYDSANSDSRDQASARPGSDKSLTREGSFASRPPPDMSPAKPAPYNGKEDPRLASDQGWARKESQDDRRIGGRNEPQDRAPLPAPPNSRPAAAADVRPNGNDPRGGPGSRDQRFNDRERERDRDRERERERDQRDYDRDRRIDYRGFRDDRRFDDRARRPPPDQRHYEPRYPEPPRRYEAKPGDESMAVDRRPDTASSSGRPAPVDDRDARPSSGPEDRQARPPPPDERSGGVLPTRSPPDARSDRLTAVEERSGKPPLDDRRPAAPPLAEERSIRPSAVPPSPDGPPRPPISDDRATRAPPPLSVDDRGGPPRPSATLDERPRPPPPSLQERISNHSSPVSRSADDRLARPAPPLDKRPPPGTPDDRIGNARPPLPPDDRMSRGPPPSDRDRDRSARPGPRGADEPIRPVLDNDRPPLDDRRGRPPPGGDRYRPADLPVGDRMPPPPPPRAPPYSSAPPPRSASAVRGDDLRVPKQEPSSPPLRRPEQRDYRPPRDMSRERVDLRATRADPDRSFGERRPDVMDVDAPPPRLSDRPSGYRRSPPPPVVDRAAPGERAHWVREPATYPPPPADDVDRRYPADSRRDWYEERDSRYDERGFRDPAWDSKPRTWDRDQRGAPPPAREFERERGVYEREPTRPPTWETREERERRGEYPVPAPPRAAYEAPPKRDLGSRITDAYPAEERAVYPLPPTRDFERGRYPPADVSEPLPSSRVRPRSPSPMRRAGPVDDLRPPMKRAREDPPYSGGGGYYSQDPPPRRDPLPAPDYPSRLPSPPVASGSAGYYERSGAPYAGGPVVRDRDFGGARDRPSDVAGYGSYDRRAPVPPSRSPPPYNRGTYNRGEPDRRYSLPPRNP
ncbi:hypothetical protein JAAARDRAFT_37047 [Jaapia argillacea MUCL 33604]|uniref:Uncharacterized protein n=1 Tax=Jaapia argillacea MUCL 33604 TaxID=933084 RepID=A0A067PWI9_9AGAM|nr:hypothetical protein JAAARDRAFT_37047 [Jaapia argillacea MUCL 33604]